MLNEDYIFLNVKADNKDQILKFIADKANEYNICDNCEGLLEDLKKREEEFPTGLQDGFAIPHARSRHVKKIAILYLRTDEAIEWGTMDDKKVNYLFSLLVPEQNEGNLHLQMISKLATCLLEDEFKNTVKSSTNKSALKDYILKNMEVD